MNAADRRDRQALVSTVGIGVGLVGVGVAAVWLFAGGGEERATAFRANAALTAGGALLGVGAGF